MDVYTKYYLNQAKTGIGSYNYGRQKGRGLGSFLSSVFRTVYPYIKKGVSALSQEIFSGGLGILTDSIKQVPIKKSLPNRVREVGNKLTERAASSVENMTGSGTKRTATKRKRQSSVGTTRKRKAKKPKKKQPKKRKVSKTKKKVKKPNKTCAKCDFKDIFSK